MKVLRCKDIGMDCHYVAASGTSEAVLYEFSEHEKTRHGRDVSADDMREWNAKIHDEGLECSPVETECCKSYGSE